MCDNIKVAIKVRPLINREKETGLTSLWRIKENTIAAIDPNIFSEPYCFDHIFDENKSTKSVFEVVAKPIIQNCMKGINGTIFAYGQTSSGKTYTMTGTDTEFGVIPLSIHQVFHEIESMAPERQFLLRIAYIEIYNEKIFDLLDGNLSELKIRDSKNGEANVKCFEVIVNSPETILHYLEQGNAAKRMEETRMNERSSRSHTIFRITIESRAIPNGTEVDDESVVQISSLNLVDLAGSEKADQTGTTGARLKEGAYINRSLFALGFVIKQLSEKGPDTFINYRDSKLTRILQASLGGNSMTSIICTITPATIDETNYTLLFATRAKTIKNKPIINETISEATAMRRLNKEISRLKQQLQVEIQKNSKYGIEQLKSDINERETKFVGSYTMRAKDKSRRRTWCPSSTHVNELSVVYEEKVTANGGNVLSSPSDRGILNPILFERESPAPFENISNLDLIDDFKMPIDDLSFGARSEMSISPASIATPLQLKERTRRIYKCAENCQCDQLEKEFNDLKEYTRLEKKTKSGIDLLPQDYQELKDKSVQKGIQIEILSSRNSELEFRLDGRDSTIKKMEKNLEEITKDLNEALKSKDVAEQAKICAEYEYDQLKKRTANREKELTDMIEEFRKNENNTTVVERIKRLENQIKAIEKQNINLQSEITDEKMKYQILEKINFQLISDLELGKIKFETCISEATKSIEILEETNMKLEKDLDNEKVRLEQMTKECENNKSALPIKVERCELCSDLTEKLEAEQLRYGTLKQDFDTLVSSDLQEIQNVVLTLQHYLKSLSSDELNGKENKNINDYIKDLKAICSSTSYVMAEKYHSNANLNQSIEEFSAADLGIKNSSFILSPRDEVIIETLQNRTIDLENQIMKISNQLNKEFDTKAIQTEWRIEEFNVVNQKYAELQTNYKRLQAEYDEISSGIMDWIQENEELKKQLNGQEVVHSQLTEKYEALLVEKQTLEEHKELSSLRTNYEEALKFNQSLQENLNDYSTLKSKYDNLFDEKHQLETQIREKLAENELLRSIETKYEVLLSDKESLEQKFAELLKTAESITENTETPVVDTSVENSEGKSRKDSLNELSCLQIKYNDLMRENQLSLDKYNELIETNKQLYHSLETLTTDHEATRNTLIVTSEKCAAVEKYRDFLSAKYASITDEYRQLYTSFTTNEIKLDNLEKETKTLKETLMEFESIQDKYEKLRTEKADADNLVGGDESEAKKLDEITILNDKFEKVVSERNLVEANYELLRSDYNAAKDMLAAKIEAMDSIRQKYEDALIERVELQKTIDALKEKSDEDLQEYEKDKNKYEDQLSQKQIECNRLEENKQELVDRIDQLQSELYNLNEKFSNLKRKHMENEKLLNEARETEKSLQQNIANLTNNMTVLQDKNEELEQVSETLKSSLEKANGFENKYSSVLIEKQILEKQILDLNIKIDDNDRKIQEMHAINEELQQAAEQAKENHNRLLADLATVQECKGAMETRLRSELVAITQKYENDLQIAEQNIEQYKLNLKNLEATKLLELESVQQLSQKKYNELKNECTKLEKSEENLKDELKALETGKTNLLKLLADLEETKSSIEKQLTSQLNSAKNECESLHIALKVVRDEKSSAEAQLSSQIIELKQKQDEMEKQFKCELNAAEQKYEDLYNTAGVLVDVQDKYDKLRTNFEELEITKTMMEKNINSVQENSDRMQICIKTLEQNKLAIEKELTKLQFEHDALKNQHTLLLGETTELEKSITTLEMENKMLKQSKQELDTVIKTQAAQIYAINTKVTESETKQIKLKVDCEIFEQKSKSLQIELDKLKSNSKSISDYLTELTEKSKRIDILENKKKELLAQLHELQNMHLFKTTQFENQVKELNGKLEESNVKLMRIQTNFNVSKNKFMNENSDLKKKNQTLFIELDDIKKKENERKSRRSMTYDNNRTALFDVQSIGTMTDKTDINCNCEIMNDKIKELTRENYIKQCHITNFKIKEKNNPLIMECSELKEKLTLSENTVINLERELTHLQIKLRKIREKSTNNATSQTPRQPERKTIGTNTDVKLSPQKSSKYNGSPSTSKPKPVHRVQTEERLIQTEFIVDHESEDELHITIRQLDAEVNRLRNRYEEAKWLAIARRRKIEILNSQIAELQNP